MIDTDAAVDEDPTVSSDESTVTKDSDTKAVANEERTCGASETEIREDDNNDEQSNDADRTWLLSRILLTWGELTVVVFAGAILGGMVSGPPKLIISLGAALASVGVLLYNVDQLIQKRLSDIKTE
ncbi:hypothetical protein [Halonotius terrestris]|uniref:hypothetical protein n=1 Tax=Halonotius terrestris TaxID=2487750 RepID=UPI001FE8EEB2|nr:hypothetical protein [Halonotius terrestris]